MKYIDADQLRVGILEVYEQEYPTATGAFDEFATRIVPNVIKQQPTVDAVPVTRCKYCKHGDKSAYGIACGITGFLKSPNGFCDEGEPKEVKCE